MNESGRRALKTAAHVLVGEVGGLDAAAAATRVGRSNLSDYGRPGQPHFMPIDVVLDLEIALHRPVVTQQLALAQGYDLVRIVADPAGGLVPAQLAAMGRETAALFATAAVALADGRLCPAERAALSGHAAELRRVLCDLAGALAAGEGGA
jgi:hypothetical protein